MALREAGLDGAIRLIRDAEPQKPSTKIGWSKTRQRPMIQARMELAGLRRADPRTLFRQLSGDLDWITLKAVEKDCASGGMKPPTAWPPTCFAT